MNYYEIFKTKVNARVEKFAKRFNDLTEKMPKMEKRLVDEKENLATLQKRRAKLDTLSEESLSADQGSYEKYKTSIRKLNGEILISEQIIGSLSKEILPKARTELGEVKRNLRIVLENLIRESRCVADNRMREILLECFNERGNFLNAWRKIFHDYNLALTISNENFCPGIWNEREIQDIVKHLPRKYEADEWLAESELTQPVAEPKAVPTQLAEFEPVGPEPATERVRYVMSEGMQKVKQINTCREDGKGKKYFCRTMTEQRIFAENNPGVKTESFDIELPADVAEKRINTPENKKQFTRQRERRIADQAEPVETVEAGPVAVAAQPGTKSGVSDAVPKSSPEGQRRFLQQVKE